MKNYKRWTAIPNEIINRSDLSMKAKIIWIYIASKPDSWEFSVAGVKTQMKEGTSAINAAVKELEDAKLLIRNRKRSEKNLFGGAEWVLSNSEIPNGIEPNVRKSNIGKSLTSNTNLSNTNSSNTNLSNTKEEKREIIFPFDDEEFKEKWKLWKQYKKEEHRFRYKSEMTEQAALMKLSRLVKKSGQFNSRTAIEIIQQSIENGWSGFFDLKKEKKNGATTAQEQAAARLVEKYGI